MLTLSLVTLMQRGKEEVALGRAGGEGWHADRLGLFKEGKRWHSGVLSLIKERAAESAFDQSSVPRRMLWEVQTHEAELEVNFRAYSPGEPDWELNSMVFWVKC